MASGDVRQASFEKNIVVSELSECRRTHTFQYPLGKPLEPKLLKALEPNLMIVHISCLLWKSTRSSRRDAGGRTGDGGRRVGDIGMEEVRQGRKEEARQSGRLEGGKEGGRETGRSKEERVRPSNEAEE